MARVGDASAYGGREENSREKHAYIKKFPGNLLWKKIRKVGQEDPRRVIHSLKVGIALTLVSLLYLLEPLFNGIGKNSMWAVMTVVVVLEFTAGATLCKGLNRGLGTILAGLLAFFIEFVATESGKIFRAVFIGVSVFLIGAATSYMRFFPYIKKNYDYGVVIFLLTFNLITVSSFRVDHVLELAQDRLITIAIGCAICLFMSLLVFPIWSGENLHNSTVGKFEALAKCIEACVNEYFNDPDEEQDTKDKDDTSEEDSDLDPIYEGYKKVLDSKSTDETLAFQSSWEPRHCNCRHRRRTPGKQYVKIGNVLRQFGYTVVALHGCLHSEIQTPHSVRAMFKFPCTRVATELSKVLTELANSIRNRRQCSPEILSDPLQEALQDLNTAIKSQPRLFLGDNSNQDTDILALAAVQAVTTRENSEKENAGRKMLRPQLSKIAITSLEFSEALPFAAFASLLVEMVARLDNVIGEVEELGRLAKFKECNGGRDEVVVNCAPVDAYQNQQQSQQDID